jgi:type II secretion system protein N
MAIALRRLPNLPKINISKQNLLLYGGYVVFFLTCFVLSAYWTFPYERVRDLLEAKVAENPSPGGRTKLTIGELGPHWLSGVALSSVVLERSTGAANETPGRLEFDELTLRASPLSLLFGGIDLDFGAEVGDGEIDGSYEADEDEPTHVEAELDAVDLAKLGIGSYLGVPIAGAATGTLDVTLAKEAAGTQGSMELKIEGLKLADGKTPVKIPGMGGLTIATVDAGTLEFKLAIRDGVATIERMEAKGKDIELSGSGSVRIATPFAQSRADIPLGAKFEEAYKRTNEKTKAAFEVMELNPLIKRSTGSDGMLRFKLSGPVTAMRSSPAGPAARSAKKRGKSAAPSLP